MDPRPEPRFDWFIPIDGDGAHIGTLRAERPPTFTVTTNRPQAVTADYQRFVVNRLRAEFKLNVPVRVFYRPKGKK